MSHKNQRIVTIYSILLFVTIILYPTLKEWGTIEQEFKKTIVMDSVIKTVPVNENKFVFYLNKNSGDTIKYVLFHGRIKKSYVSADSLAKVGKNKPNQDVFSHVSKTTQITGFYAAYALVIFYFALSILFYLFIEPHLKPSKPKILTQYVIPLILYVGFLIFGGTVGYPHVEIYNKTHIVKEGVDGIYDSIETKEGVWYFYKNKSEDTFFIDTTRKRIIKNGSVVEKKKGGEFLALPSAILSGFILSFIFVLFNSLYRQYRINVDYYEEKTNDNLGDSGHTIT